MDTPVASVEGNLFEFYEYSAAAIGQVVVKAKGYSYVSFRPSPWANTVFDLDFPSVGLPEGLVDGISSGAVPNKLRVGPGSHPLDIEARLVEAGFDQGPVSRGMTLELARRVPQRASRDLDLESMKSEENFIAAARLCVENLFETGIETAPHFARLLSSLGRDRAFGFLGRVGGEPASTAFAFIDGAGVGGLYFVATAAGMRGRGYGAAIVGAALDELERRGVELCILHATEPGLPIYLRLGFVDACRLSYYSLPAVAAQA
jgi:GNAT superfamily N-acetyltransferase